MHFVNCIIINIDNSLEYKNLSNYICFTKNKQTFKFNSSDYSNSTTFPKLPVTANINLFKFFY